MRTLELLARPRESSVDALTRPNIVSGTTCTAKPPRPEMKSENPDHVIGNSPTEACVPGRAAMLHVKHEHVLGRVGKHGPAHLDLRAAALVDVAEEVEPRRDLGVRNPYRGGRHQAT